MSETDTIDNTSPPKSNLPSAPRTSPSPPPAPVPISITVTEPVNDAHGDGVSPSHPSSPVPLPPAANAAAATSSSSFLDDPSKLIGLRLSVKNKERSRWNITRDNAIKKRPSYYRPSAQIYNVNGVTILRASLVNAVGEMVAGYGEKVMKMIKLGEDRVWNKNKLWMEFLAGVEMDRLFLGQAKPYIEHEEFGMVVVCQETGGGKTQTAWLTLTMGFHRTWEDEVASCNTLLELLERAEKLYLTVNQFNKQALHGDIKPSNLVVVSDESAEGGYSIRLIDLECAVAMTGVISSGVGGTLSYLAVGLTARRLLFALDEALKQERVTSELHKEASKLLNEDKAAENDPSCKQTDVWAVGMIILESLVPNGIIGHTAAAVDLSSLENRLDTGVDDEKKFLEDLDHTFQHFVSTYDIRAWETKLGKANCVHTLLRFLISRGVSSTVTGDTQRDQHILDQFRILRLQLKDVHPIPLPAIRPQHRGFPVSTSRREAGNRAQHSGHSMASVGVRKSASRVEGELLAERPRTASANIRSWDSSSVAKETTLLGNTRVQQPGGSWFIEQYILDIDGTPTIHTEPLVVEGTRFWICRLPRCSGRTTFSSLRDARVHVTLGNPSTCPWVTANNCTRKLHA